MKAGGIFISEEERFNISCSDFINFFFRRGEMTWFSSLLLCLSTDGDGICQLSPLQISSSLLSSVSSALGELVGGEWSIFDRALSHDLASS